MKKPKRTYRDNMSEEIARIDERRLALNISHQELYQTAEVSRSTYQRLRRDNVAFPRTIQALRYALRTIEQRLKNAERILP